MDKDNNKEPSNNRKRKHQPGLRDESFESSQSLTSCSSPTTTPASQPALNQTKRIEQLTLNKLNYDVIEALQESSEYPIGYCN